MLTNTATRPSETTQGLDDIRGAVNHARATAATVPTTSRTACAPQQRGLQQAKILIVDDESFNIQVTKKYLKDAGYENFVTTTESTTAVDLIWKESPDLILLDIMMPHVSGLDILARLCEDDRSRHTPRLILTASTDGETKRKALELGATDFLMKPVDPHDLLPRVRNLLTSKAYQNELANQAQVFEEQVRKRTAELADSRREILHCLARAAEFRDDDTGHHVHRVGRYVRIIASELGLPESRVELLELAAQLHDIGKIGVPDSILHKPGKLDPDEYAIMQKHCAFAKQVIAPLPDAERATLRSHARLGSSLLSVRSSPLLMLAARIAQTHHERWDGTGYPLGLAEEDIPLEGRITAVADVYDALSTKRPYKPAFPREKCFGILEEGRGTHFDSKVLDAFFRRSEDIIQVQLDFMDAH